MNGAGFWGSRFAGVASALGMENIGLENKNLFFIVFLRYKS